MTEQSGSQQGMTGKTIGQYELEQEIGRGGMATVYSARQLSMNRMVAIKVLPRHFLHDPGFLERFEREVDVISNLEHPHILPIYDYGETEGVPYIAMRYLGGGSMADMIRRGVPELKDIVQPMRQVGEALDYAHQRGVIHRDLKPGNIMLDESGNAYLSDFGIARVMGSDLTGSAIIGTPAYMSPEQAHGAPIDARSDIYSLGIVLFELITGQEPYHAETPMGLLLMHINEPIPPLTKYRDDVPSALQLVVERATAKDPDQRFSSAGELAEALAAAVRGEAVTPRPMAPVSYPPPQSGAPMAFAPATNPPTAPPSPTSPDSQQFYGDVVSGTGTQVPQRRSPWPWVIGLILLVVIAGGAIFALSGGLPGTNVATVPTPFRGADTVEDAVYSLSIPSRWPFRDQSDVSRLMHTWRADDDSAFVILTQMDDDSTTPESFNSRVLNGDVRFIDETTAEDGTLRRSYRVINHPTLPNGQIDQFFYRDNDKLTVVEMFLSDGNATNTTSLTTMQAVLNSLRLR